MQRILGAIAFTYFIISFLIHLGTFFGFNAGEAFPIIWSIPLFIFLLAFLVFRELGRHQNLITAFPILPIWCWKLLISFMCYTFMCFLMLMFGGAGRGTPVRIDGTYAIYQTNEGQRVFIQTIVADVNLERVKLSGTPTLQTRVNGIRFYAEITEAEYYQHTNLWLRMVTCACMVFFLFLTLYSWYPIPKRDWERWNENHY